MKSIDKIHETSCAPFDVRYSGTALQNFVQSVLIDQLWMPRFCGLEFHCHLIACKYVYSCRDKYRKEIDTK